MPAPRRRAPTKAAATHVLTVRLDSGSRACLSEAAERRGLSLRDYVRTVAVGHAQREIAAAREHTLALTPDEQLSFWNALAEPVKLTESQRTLGTIMRGDA